MVLMKVEHSQEQGYTFPLKCSGERELNNQSFAFIFIELFNKIGWNKRDQQVLH